MGTTILNSFFLIAAGLCLGTMACDTPYNLWVKVLMVLCVIFCGSIGVANVVVDSLSASNKLRKDAFR